MARGGSVSEASPRRTARRRLVLAADAGADLARTSSAGPAARGLDMASARPSGRSSGALEAPERSPSDLAELEGTARTPDGLPLAGCRVELTTTTRRRFRLARTDVAGDFRFDHLAPGRGYRLRLTPPAAYREELVALVLEPGPQHVEVILAESGLGRLRLRLIDTEGSPLAERVLGVRGASSVTGTGGVTGSDGWLALEAVPSGSVVLESLHEPRLSVSGLEVGSGEDLVAVATAAVGEHSLEGAVVDRDGGSLIGVRVSAEWSRRVAGVRASVIQIARTDGGGRFRLHGLGAGHFAVSAVAGGYLRSRATVVVPSAEPVLLELSRVR